MLRPSRCRNHTFCSTGFRPRSGLRGRHIKCLFFSMAQSREKAIASFVVNPCKSHFLRRPEFSWSRQPNAGANWRELPPLAAVLTRIEFPFSEILLNCGPCARRPLPFQGKTESSLRRDCDVLPEAPRPPPCKALKTCVSEGKFLGFIWPPPSISLPRRNRRRKLSIA